MGVKMIEKIKSFFAQSLSGIMILFFIYAEIAGIYHSSNKHPDDGSMAYYIPPFGWYRAIELWWHDDFADVDWKKRIDIDKKAIYYYLSNPINQTLHPQEYEALCKRIQSYPEKQKNYLKNFAKYNIEFDNSVKLDMISYIKENKIIRTQERMISNKTKNLQEKVKYYFTREEYNEFQKGIEKGWKALDEVLENYPSLDYEKFEANLEENVKKDLSSSKQVFKDVFNKSLSF